MDMEFNPMALAISGIASAILITLVWKLEAWDNFGLQGKILATIFLPILNYFGILWQLNKG